MTSNDNQQYLTIELFNSRMETFMAQIQLGNEQLRNELRSEFQTGFNTLHNEIQLVDAKVQVNSAKLEMLQHTFYWGFAIMTFIITLVAILVPYFLLNNKEKHQPVLTEQKVQGMITKTVDEAVAKALGVFGKR